MSTQKRITARTLKGFRDHPPEAMIPREKLIETARQVYRSYGFSPIDTPALEYLETLAGKGGEETDRQLYRFQDHGGRWVGLRFDLTVPLARFVAQHITQLGTPFKRYHIGKVWRGENTQRGRYREFLQCDFDTIGTRSLAADIETTLVIHDLLRAIGFSEFTIRLNHRQLLNGLLERLELQEQANAVLRTLDKLAKIGPKKVRADLTQTAGCNDQQAEQILRFLSVSGSNAEILRQLPPLVAGSPTARAGLEQLAELLEAVAAAGVQPKYVALDLSIARGLDYYTGTVFETFLDTLPGIGSVCSGGRYDNLAQLFTSQQLPGIGASLGLDRLLAAMEELGMIAPTRTAAPVLIPFFDKQRLKEYLRLAALLRSAGIAVEVYPEAKRLSQQLKYADRRGFRVALIAGEDEFRSGTCRVKDLATATEQEVPLEEDAAELIAAINRLLAQ